MHALHHSVRLFRVKALGVLLWVFLSFPSNADSRKTNQQYGRLGRSCSGGCIGSGLGDQTWNIAGFLEEQNLGTVDSSTIVTLPKHLWNLHWQESPWGHSITWILCSSSSDRPTFEATQNLPFFFGEWSACKQLMLDKRMGRRLVGMRWVVEGRRSASKERSKHDMNCVDNHKVVHIIMLLTFVSFCSCTHHHSIFICVLFFSHFALRFSPAPCRAGTGGIVCSPVFDVLQCSTRQACIAGSDLL